MDKKTKSFFRKLWWFVWEDDSIWSWLVNIIIAFVLIKFIVYPVLGIMLGTSHPIVAVVSGSMEHKLVHPCVSTDQHGQCVSFNPSTYSICGKNFGNKFKVDFDFFWAACGGWYLEKGISAEDFDGMSFRNGFNTGDIMILLGTKPAKLEVGDVVVFMSSRPDPIIHRIVKKWDEDGKYYFQTKGDHNSVSYSFEEGIPEDHYVGRAVVRVPLLGYVKILAVKAMNLVLR